MVTFFGSLAMNFCKTRQARKGATVAGLSCAGVWLGEVISNIHHTASMKTIKTLFLVLFITLILFWVAAEGFSHYSIYHYYHSDTQANAYLQTMLLYQDVNHFMDKRNHNDLNSDNIRYHRESTDHKKKDINVVFLGDSFVYGFLLSHQASIPYQFEEIAREKFSEKSINGINFGWASGSPYIELNLLKKLGKKYRPDVVVLDLDLGDFSDDIRYEMMDKQQTIYRFGTLLPFTTLLLDTFSKKLDAKNYEKFVGHPKSQLFINERPLKDSLPYLKNHTEKNIDAIYKYTTNKLGAKFILFINPKTFHYNENESPNNWLKDIIKKTPYSFEIFDYIQNMSEIKPYPVISLLPIFKATRIFPTAFDNDAHWNRAGYKIAATEMVEQCRKLGCFNKPSPSSPKE